MTGSRSAMFVCTKYTKVMSPEKEETRYCSSSMTIGHAVFITRAHMWWCDGPLVLFSSIFWLKTSRRKPNRVIQCLAPNTFPKQVITFPQKSVHSPSIRKVCQKSPFSRHDLCLENFPFHRANFATWFLDWKLLPLELFRKFICFAEVYLWHLASILCCDCWGARVQCARRALWAQQLLLLRGTHGGSTQGSVSAVSSAPEQPGYGGSISWMKHKTYCEERSRTRNKKTDWMVKWSRQVQSVVWKVPVSRFCDQKIPSRMGWKWILVAFKHYRFRSNSTDFEWMIWVESGVIKESLHICCQRTGTFWDCMVNMRESGSIHISYVNPSFSFCCDFFDIPPYSQNLGNLGNARKKT